MNTEWWAAIAAWVGAAVALTSGVGALIAWWWRRPQAQWAFGLDGIAGSPWGHARFAAALHLSATPNYIVRATNVGDGAAFDIKVVGVGCEATPFEFTSADVRGVSPLMAIGAISTNSHLKIAVHVPHQAHRAGIRIEWTQPPTRHQRRLAQSLVLVGDGAGPSGEVLRADRWSGLDPRRRANPRVRHPRRRLPLAE